VFSGRVFLAWQNYIHPRWRINIVNTEKRKKLTTELYELVLVSTSYIERIEEITMELQEDSDKEDFDTLILMRVTAREYRLKFRNIAKAIEQKYFNIVEFAKRRVNKIGFDTTCI
jgi:hypothetical protein